MAATGQRIESHHVVPKALKQGGEKDRDNLVHLTLREHFIAHLLLTKMFTGEPRLRMLAAFTLMSASGRFGKHYHNRMYHKIRSEFYERRALIVDAWSKEPRPLSGKRRRSVLNGKGTPHTEEWKLQQAQRARDQWARPGARDALRNQALNNTVDVERSRAAAKKQMSDPETRRRLAEFQKTNQAGRVIVFHSELDIERRVVPEQLEHFLSLGYRKGRRRRGTSHASRYRDTTGRFKAAFERALLKERQREGIAIAKKAGVYKGRKPSLTPERLTELRGRVAAGEKKAALAREFGISRETLYQYVPVKR
jgi:hypothetical protein